MAWTAPRSWSAGEIVTAALLNAQLRDNMLMLEYGASTGVTAATNVTSSATTVSRAGGHAFVNVNATATAALSTGDTLFTLPAGFRPTRDPIFVNLLTTSGTPVRAHAYMTGVVTTEQGITSGVILRGQFMVPLG